MSIVPSSLPLVLLFGTVTFLVPACSCGEEINLGARDAGADGGRRTARSDECGNGLDDDGNGAIDDGCPCAPGESQRCFSGALSSNGVGACSGGTQVCAPIEGSEWGDWGESECRGEVLPVAERCDGTDADCDGAIDEGCPCTEGMTRSCGDEFILAPCMAGTQSCRGGTWSACEGAIGPTADVCDDALDNDCDGLTNEGCECPYPPVPEVCRDAVDNDCDGAIDEPECSPDWPGDAGMPWDAGMCDPALGTARLVAPLSTSRVSSRRPTVRWELPAGASAAELELCADPTCATVIERITGAGSARPTRPLPVGPVFFRARVVSADGFACGTSHVWEMFVGHADASVDTAQGHVMDVDRDGLPDLVAGGFQHLDGTWMNDETYLLLGAETGPATALTLPAETSLATLIPVGDLDGDGFGDVVRLRSSGDCDVRRGAPDGIDTTPVFTLASCRTVSGIGDFDGDGYGDLVLAFNTSGPAQLVFGAADLSSMVSVADSIAIPNGWGYVHRAGDVDGDGLGDVVINRIVKVRDTVHHNRYTPSVYLGNATRRWGSPIVLTYIDPVGLAVPDGFAAGDFNGDGYGDLLFAPMGDGLLHVGSSGGPVVPATAVPLGGTLMALAAVGRLGDIDGDGFDDAEVHGRVRYGSPTGLGPAAETIASYCENRARCSVTGIGDVDRDGFEDVVESNQTTHVVRWLSGGAGGLSGSHPIVVDSADAWYPVVSLSDD